MDLDVGEAPEDTQQAAAADPNAVAAERDDVTGLPAAQAAEQALTEEEIGLLQASANGQTVMETLLKCQVARQLIRDGLLRASEMAFVQTVRDYVTLLFDGAVDRCRTLYFERVFTFDVLQSTFCQHSDHPCSLCHCEQCSHRLQDICLVDALVSCYEVRMSVLKEIVADVDYILQHQFS